MPRPRSRLARQKALDATTALIVERGLAAVTYDAVAAQSGVAKTTLYRHWPERDALLLDAVNDHFHAIAVPDTGTLRGDIVEYFRRMRREEFRGTRADLFPSILEAAQRDPGMQLLVDRIAEQRRTTMAEMVGRARARGEITAEFDDETLLGVILGPLVFQKVIRRRPITPRYIAGCINIVLTGLGLEGDSTAELLDATAPERA